MVQKTVKYEVATLSPYEISGSVVSVIEQLKKFQEKYPGCSIHCEFEYFSVQCERLETEAEMILREHRADKRQRDLDAEERETFYRLKNKFGYE